MKLTGLFFLLIATLASCSTPPETTFTQWGLQVAVPEGWELVDEEDYGENSYYIAIEQRGLTTSGVVTIIWFDEEYDLEEFNQSIMTSITEEIGNDVIIRDSDRDFGKHSTYAQEYLFSFLDMPHTGVMHTFYLDGKTLCIGQQWANEDVQNVKAGFDRISETLKLGEEFVAAD